MTHAYKPQRAAAPLPNRERVRRYRQKQRERNLTYLVERLYDFGPWHLDSLLRRASDATLADLRRCFLDWDEARPFTEPHSVPVEEG